MLLSATARFAFGNKQGVMAGILGGEQNHIDRLRFMLPGAARAYLQISVDG